MWREKISTDPPKVRCAVENLFRIKSERRLANLGHGNDLTEVYRKISGVLCPVKAGVVRKYE